MKTRLADFARHATTGVFVSEQQGEFAYSDGQSVEKRMLDIVSSARNVDVFSPELVGAICDWPSEYHFSPRRANIIWPLTGIGPGTRVLELGCGCGAITKALAETGCQVDAVEGSFQRASVAAARVRHHPDARVHVSNFQDVAFEPVYDVVTLIGVLEYSPVYIDAEDPFTACLEMAAVALKPGGTLVIAIENKLGLKYFSGITEDHFGIAHYGIEGRYGARQITTYGKRQLNERLQRAGLTHVAFHYAYPDYKLPEVILTERGAQAPGFNAADLVSGLESRDYSGVGKAAFRLDLTAESLGEEGLLGEMANSFLVLASREAPSQHIAPDTLALKYTDDREPSFNCVTRFAADGEKIGVHKAPLQGEHGAKEAVIAQTLGNESYAYGRNLLACMRRELVCGRQEGFARLLRMWSEHLAAQAATVYLAPDWADAVPANFILREDGTLQLIDREWRASTSLELDFVQVCGLYALAQDKVIGPLLGDAHPDKRCADLGLLIELDVTRAMLESVNRYRNTVWHEIYGDGRWRTYPYDRQSQNTAPNPVLAPPQLENTRVNQAAELIDAGQLPEAHTLLMQHLEAKPGDVETLFQLGRLAFAAGMPADALNILQEIVTQAPAVRPQVAQLSEELRAQGQEDNSTLLDELLREATTPAQNGGSDNGPAESASALLDQGRALLDAGRDLEGANELLQQALEAAPGDPHVLFELGRLAFKANLPEDGYEILKEAAQSAEVLPKIMQLGETYVREGQSQNARIILDLLRKATNAQRPSGTPEQGLARIRTLSDHEWMELLCRSHIEPDYHGFRLPGFPDKQFQINTMGSAHDDAMREAYLFYRAVKPFIDRMRPLDERTLLDFGTGWGRFARTFVKTFEPHNIWGIDVDPSMIDACNDAFGFGNFRVTQPFPPTDFDDASFDPVTAYSVFSHLSEEAAGKWMSEFSRILRPGGFAAFTTQGRSFISQCAYFRAHSAHTHKWHEKLARSFVDEELCYADYDSGKFLFSATGGGDTRPSTFYGEALVPVGYMIREWGHMFDLMTFIDDRNIMPQAFAVLRRK